MAFATVEKDFDITMKRSHWTPDSPHKALHIALASATLLSLSAVPSLAAGSMADTAPSTSGVYVAHPGARTRARRFPARRRLRSRLITNLRTACPRSTCLSTDARWLRSGWPLTEGRGEISFLVSAGALRGGSHTIVVRATATDAEVASARTMLNLSASSGADVKTGGATTGLGRTRSARSGRNR